MLIEIEENQINFVVDKSKETGTLLLLHLSSCPYCPEAIPDDPNLLKRYTMVEVRQSGVDQYEHMGGTARIL